MNSVPTLATAYTALRSPVRWPGLGSTSRRAQASWLEKLGGLYSTLITVLMVLMVGFTSPESALKNQLS